MKKVWITIISVLIFLITACLQSGGNSGLEDGKIKPPFHIEYSFDKNNFKPIYDFDIYKESYSLPDANTEHNIVLIKVKTDHNNYVFLGDNIAFGNLTELPNVGIMQLTYGKNRSRIHIKDINNSKAYSFNINITRKQVHQNSIAFKKVNADGKMISARSIAEETRIPLKADTSSLKFILETEAENALIIIFQKEYKGKAEITVDAKKSVTAIPVSVKAPDGRIFDYRFLFMKPESNTLLKNILITPEIKGFNFIPSEMIYTAGISQGKAVTVTAEPYNSDVEILMNGKEISSFTVDKPVELKIKVKKDIYETSYKVNFVLSAKETTVNFDIFSGNYGDIVDGTKLKAFVSSNPEKLVKETTVVNGKANIRLESGKIYNFLLEGIKGKYASSLLQEYFISELPEQSIIMIQKPHKQPLRSVIPPKITNIKIDGINKLENGSVISKKIPHISVEFLSPSGSIEYFPQSSFGARIGIGCIPSEETGLFPADYSVDEAPSGVGSLCIYNFPGKIISEHGPRTPNLFTEGKTYLVFAAEDSANNRVQKHVDVVFKDAKENASLISAEIKNFSVYTHSFNSPKGVPSYRSIISFYASENKALVRLLGFDIYRRKKGEDVFKRIEHRLYGFLSDGDEFSENHGLHVGYDTLCALKAGEIYEYKIAAFTDSINRLESYIVPAAVLPTFDSNLIYPENRKMIKLQDTNDLEYTIKISSTEIFKNPNLKSMNIGLIISDLDGTALYASNLTYWFDYYDEHSRAFLGRPEIVIRACDPKTKKYPEYTLPLRLTRLKENGWVDKSVTPESLIKIDKVKGTITFTKKFLNMGLFNVVEAGEELASGEPMKYEAGMTYLWDIHNWGEAPDNTNDDQPLGLVCAYEIFDRNGNPAGLSKAQSFGNTLEEAAGSKNGRFELTVIGK